MSCTPRRITKYLSTRQINCATEIAPNFRISESHAKCNDNNVLAL